MAREAEYEAEYADEREFTFTDLIMRLWRGRVLIVLLPLFAMGLAAAYVGFSATQTNNPIVYFINLKSIENQRYPNGTEFSPRNLVIPEALAEIRDRFDLPSQSALREALTVTYDSPISPGLTRLYRERLSARNLSQPEIAAINEEFSSAMRDALRSTVRIDLDYRLLGVDRSVGTAIAKAIPEIWARVYVDQFRVFLDTGLAVAAITRGEEDLESTSSILSASSRLSAMETGLQTVSQDNRLRSVITDNGASAVDLKQELQRFRTNYFNPILAFAFNNEDPVSSMHLADRRYTIAELRRRIVGHDQTLTEMRQYQRPHRAMEVAESAGVGDRESIQLADGALSEILRMAQQATFSQFVEETLRSRQALVQQISLLQKELDMANDASGVEDSLELRKAAATELDRITRQYLEILDRSRTLLADRSGDFYEPAAGPAVAGDSFLSSRNVLILLVAGLVAGMIAVLLALILPSIRPRRQPA